MTDFSECTSDMGMLSVRQNECSVATMSLLKMICEKAKAL